MFDNLDRVTRVGRHDTTSTGNLIARSETKYDDLGRVHQTKRYAVDVSTGTVGNSLTDNTWYDEAGSVIKQKPAGSEAFTKQQYDSLGRQGKQFIGFDVDETSYPEAFNVSGDTIFEQSETDYDDASNVVETRLRRRHHDATGTGELTTPTGSDPNARVSYVAHYSDAVGRQIAITNYGTNDDTALSRSSTIPARSDDILVTTIEYNDDGEAFKTIDPADKEDRTKFDAMGRVIATIENYTDGDATTGGNDEDITVEYTYTADGQQATITARQKSSADDQTTQYVYGTSRSDSDVARTDLLRAVIYPDSDDTFTMGIGSLPVLSDGADGIYDRVEHKYNCQGEVSETKDQNGTVHAFDFDKLGRQTHDRVTTLGTNIDGAVRRISISYEVRGQIEKITSYDNATVGSGSVVNEVLREYNDAGLLDKEYQEHDGAKDASTLYTGYNYDQSSSGGEFTKGLRRQSLRYPNDRLVHYTYGSSGSDADNLNRLDAIKDDNSGSPGVTLASYTYLGLGTMVIEDLAEPEVKLDYCGGTSGIYTGLDRFDRIVDQRWYDYGASEDRDRYKYGYDRASNRTWKENVVSKNLSTAVYLDEFYSHDGVNRLTNMDRGQLNGTQTGVTGTPLREEAWTLDALANWSNCVHKSNGGTELDQDRTVNKTNEILGIDESAGTPWSTPSYDANGNMTSMPQSVDLTSSYDCTWDAWNRLVMVEDSSVLIARYEYDARMRRVKKSYDSNAPESPNGIDSYVHYYYCAGSQLAETRTTATSSHEPDSLPPKHQYLWSSRYIDALFLRDENTDHNNTCDDERLYYTRDGNMNVTGLLSTNGNVLERYTYDSYGKSTLWNSDWSVTRAASSYSVLHGYTGRMLDRESLLYYYRARYYHVQLGTFTRRDPIEYVDGLNLYEYVGSRPHLLVDPQGLVRASFSLFWGGTIKAIGYQKRRISHSTVEYEADWRISGSIENAQVTQRGGKTLFTGTFELEFSFHRPKVSPRLDVKWILAGDKDRTSQVVDRWKEPGVIIRGPMDSKLNPHPSSKYCVHCLAWRGDIDVEELSGASSVEGFQTMVGLLVNGVSLIQPEAQMLRILTAGGMLADVLEQDDQVSGIKFHKANRVSFAMVICADGRRMVGIYKIPRAVRREISTSTSMVRWSSSWTEGSFVTSDPGGKSEVLGVFAPRDRQRVFNWVKWDEENNDSGEDK